MINDDNETSSQQAELVVSNPFQKERKSNEFDETRTDAKKAALKREINGPKGLEPTRYGDWESKGRCSDF